MHLLWQFTSILYFLVSHIELLILSLFRFELFHVVLLVLENDTFGQSVYIAPWKLNVLVYNSMLWKLVCMQFLCVKCTPFYYIMRKNLSLEIGSCGCSSEVCWLCDAIPLFIFQKSGLLQVGVSLLAHRPENLLFGTDSLLILKWYFRYITLIIVLMLLP